MLWGGYMKALFLIGILIFAVFIIGCAAEQEKTVVVEQKEAEQQEVKTEEAVKSVTEKIEPFCGDGNCNADEDCNTCPEDCGDCDFSIFSGECTREGIYHNIKLEFKNLNPEQLNIEAYPRGIFTDVGIFYGETKELIIEPRSIKAYVWSFNIGENKIADEVKIVMMQGNNKILTNKITIDCIED